MIHDVVRALHKGAYIIEPLRALQEVLPFVRSHHERTDGRVTGLRTTPARRAHACA